MPADVCPSFHCRPSTASTLLFPSASIRQTPTTLKNDFGSPPTVSSEKSSFRGCPALTLNSNAASPTQAAAVPIALLIMFMDDLRP
jgi:hypothetical protein